MKHYLVAHCRAQEFWMVSVCLQVKDRTLLSYGPQCLFLKSVSTHHSILVYFMQVGRVAQLVQRLATGWTVRGSNPGGGEIFHSCPDRPWGLPSLLYNGYRVFSGGKERSGRDADPSPPSSAMVKKGQSYTRYLYSPYGPYGLYRASVPVQG